MTVHDLAWYMLGAVSTLTVLIWASNLSNWLSKRRNQGR
jgi:hypothetical protein